MLLKPGKINWEKDLSKRGLCYWNKYLIAYLSINTFFSIMRTNSLCYAYMLISMHLKASLRETSKNFSWSMILFWYASQTLAKARPRLCTRLNQALLGGIELLYVWIGLAWNCKFKHIFSMSIYLFQVTNLQIMINSFQVSNQFLELRFS